MSFLKFGFSSDMLILGERFKKGQYRPVITTIPYSQITGALQAIYGNGKYGLDAKQIHSCGHFLIKDEGDFRLKHIETLTYSPRNRSMNSSILPIYTEYLYNVEGIVYLKENEDVREVVNETNKGDIPLWMGGLKSKGFGKCKLNFRGIINDKKDIEVGNLNTRLPIIKLCSPCFETEEEDVKKLIEHGIPTKFLQDVFGIKRIKTANFGYLFEPTSETQGKYVLSLFEGSKVEAPKFLLKEKRDIMMNIQTDDIVSKVIEEIRNNRKIGGYFSSNFLNSVGDILEKEGNAMTKTFLWERSSRRDLRHQAEALLEVIKILEKYHSIDRKTGRFVIKSLISILSEGGSNK